MNQINLIQKTVAVAAVLFFVMLEATIFAPISNAEPAEWVMMVENTSGDAGLTGHIIHINGSWNDSINGYYMAMYYDATKIEIADVSLVGTVSEFEIAPEVFEYWTLVQDNYVSEEDSYVVAYAYNPKPSEHDYIIPQGQGTLFKLIINIPESAPTGDTVALDLEDDVGAPDNGCFYTNTSGVNFTADKLDGVLTIRYGNDPPLIPSWPYPENYETNVSIEANLSWISGDNNPGTPVDYDIYLGITSPPSKLVSNLSWGVSPFVFYDPGTLDYNTTYYWRIVAWDNHGASTKGPLWEFTTERNISPFQDRLVISAPSLVIEGESFQVTVKANGTPVADVQVTFADTKYYTNTNGIATLIAPSVTQNTKYSITANKTGYLDDTIWIMVRNQEDTPPTIQLISPNGGETWRNTQLIQWTITPSQVLTGHAVTIQYRQRNDSWITIVDDLEDISSPYSWDTRMIPDAYPYWIKVILKSDDDKDGEYETIVSQDASNNPFAIDNSVTHMGWVYGTVVKELENRTAPVKDAMVCLILSDENNVITNKCTSTDAQGVYIIEVTAGAYTMKAGTEGYITSAVDRVTIWANETTIVNFTLEMGIDEEPGVFPIIVEENRKEINNAIATGDVAAELIIQREKDEYKSVAVSYDTVSINLTSVAADQISVVVNGDEYILGKTIVISGEGFAFDQEIVVEYDGEPIAMADDIADVLNSNDDGVNPEYLVTKGAIGWQIIVTNPHFSEHEITIYTLEEAVGDITAVILYVIILAIASIVFVGTGELFKRL